MRLTVVTDQTGKVVGTARQLGEGDPAAGSGGLVAGPGQEVHAIDVPDELQEIQDPDELHSRLKGYLPSQ